MTDEPETVATAESGPRDEPIPGQLDIYAELDDWHSWFLTLPKVPA